MFVSLVGSGTMSDTTSEVNLGLQDLLPGYTSDLVVIYVLKFVGGIAGLLTPGPGWVLGYTDGGWDGNNEKGLWAHRAPEAPTNRLAITWDGASRSWCLAAAAYRAGGAVMAQAVGGFNNYMWPSATDVPNGGALVHVKAGDKDDEFGPCPIGANPFENVANIAVGGVGTADLQQSLAQTARTFTGANVGDDKGIGAMYVLLPRPETPRRRRRLR